jgi:hypothetical protein
MRPNKEEQAPLQLGGRGLSEREQTLLVQLGRMMGPVTDEFDDEVQRLHDERHNAEHEAIDYEKEFGGELTENKFIDRGNTFTFEE